MSRWAAGALVVASTALGVVTVPGSAFASPSHSVPPGLQDGMMPADSPDARATTGVSPQSRTTAQAQPQVLAATAAAAPVPLGIDVSHHQDDVGAIDWAKVASSGQKFAITKAIEAYTDSSTGQTKIFTDPYLASHLAGARAAGLVVGAYVFARPQYSATMQADAFAAAIGTLPAGSLPPVLDLETTGGLTVTQLVAWTHAFLNRLQTDTGVLPMIYSGPSFWSFSMGGSTQFTQYPLWEAHYTTAAAPYAMGGWPTWTLWQFTNTATVDGVTGAVDQDRFNSATGATLSNLHLPTGSLDTAKADGTGRLTVSGWTIDPDAPATPTRVDVYVDGTRSSVTANLARTDVAATYPLAGTAHGYAATAQGGPGQHTLCVYAVDTSDSSRRTGLGCRTLTVTPNYPYGAFESATAYGTGRITVRGWTIDPDTPTVSTRVNVLVDGHSLGVLTANVSRPDVGAAHPTAGNLHGFSGSVVTGPGAHTVCVYAIDTSFPSRMPRIGCKAVTVTPRNPFGSYESAVVDSAGHLTVRGWTIDPDTPTTPVRVKAYVDGVGLPSLLANGARLDVARKYPTAGSLHGFTISGQVTKGRHSVCVWAADTSFPTRTLRLGCRTVG